MSEVIAQAAQSAVESAINSQGEAASEEVPFGAKPAPTVATPSEPEKPAAAAPKDDYSERIAQMARQQRRMQEESKAAHAKVKEYEARFARLKASPESVLEEEGWNAEKYLERLATGKTPDPTIEDNVKSLKEEIDRLKKANEDKETSLKSQAEQKAVADFKASIKTKAEQNQDRYEAIAALGMFDTVYQTVEEVFQQSGELPDLELVMDAVEKDLAVYIEKAAKTKKYAGMFKPTDVQAPEQKPQQMQGGSTLTATTTATTQPPAKRLTDDERMAAAMATLKFK